MVVLPALCTPAEVVGDRAPAFLRKVVQVWVLAPEALAAVSVAAAPADVSCGKIRPVGVYIGYTYDHLPG